MAGWSDSSTADAQANRRKSPEAKRPVGMRQINPSGKISLNPSGKSPLRFCLSHPMRGADRDRHERAVGCGGRGLRLDERRVKRTVKRVVLTPRCWRQVRGETKLLSGRRWQKCRAHRGERGIIRKPLRRESRMPPLDLYARVRILTALLHTRPRVQRASGLPCALLFLEGVNRRKPRTHRAARMRGMFVDTTSVVITRESG